MLSAVISCMCSTQECCGSTTDRLNGNYSLDKKVLACRLKPFFYNFESVVWLAVLLLSTKAQFSAMKKVATC